MPLVSFYTPLKHQKTRANSMPCMELIPFKKKKKKALKKLENQNNMNFLRDFF